MEKSGIFQSIISAFHNLYDCIVQNAEIMQKKIIYDTKNKWNFSILIPHFTLLHSVKWRNDTENCMC